MGRPRRIWSGGRWITRPAVGGRWIGGRWLNGRWIGRRWVGPRYYRPYGIGVGVGAPVFSPQRPWIFRRPPPPWLWRLVAPYAAGYGPGVMPPPEPPPPMDEPGAPPPPEEPPPRPEPAAAAGPPPAPDAGPGDDQGQGGPPPGGGGNGAPAAGPPDAGGGGGEAPAGELPAMVAVDGRQVPIRWANAAREVGEVAPRGGGVYVVMRDGVPEAAHLTNDFASDVARRYGTQSETEGEDEEGEWGFRRRWGFRGRRGRRGRRSMWYGRPGRGRWGRRFMRSLRTRMSIPDQQDEPDGGDGQEPPEE